jgi:23S rRNA (uracil1939-C5)-methyltransferase
MKKNDIFEMEITGMTHEGLGVGKKDGMAVFVQGAIDGELVRAKVIKLAKNYAVARVEDWLQKSPHRQEPFCKVYRRCGGCSLQHMSYAKQLEFKQRVVKDNLERIGGFKDIRVNPVIGMETPMHYRNKAQYPVGMGEKGAVAGFYARRTHEIIASDNCAIQDTASESIRNAVVGKIKELGISPYDEKTGRGLLRHIITRVAHSTGDIMVMLVVTSEKIPHLDLLIQHILKASSKVKSIVLNLNTRRDNVILGDKVMTVYGADFLVDTLGPFQFHISPLSFYQVNPVQTVALYEKAVEYAALTGKETVYDLYCGIGTISLFLARQAKQVIGVEVVDEAAQAARKNAEINRIDNTEFHAGLAEEVVPRLYQMGKKADVVVVDPPRKGCDQKLLETMVQMQPERIVYVSCNPSTLARDLKYLGENGYGIKEVQPVDMFPWSEHVECVVLMTNVKNK